MAKSGSCLIQPLFQVGMVYQFHVPYRLHGLFHHFYLLGDRADCCVGVVAAACMLDQGDVLSNQQL